MGLFLAWTVTWGQRGPGQVTLLAVSPAVCCDTPMGESGVCHTETDRATHSVRGLALQRPLYIQHWNLCFSAEVLVRLKNKVFNLPHSGLLNTM